MRARGTNTPHDAAKPPSHAYRRAGAGAGTPAAAGSRAHAHAHAHMQAQFRPKSTVMRTGVRRVPGRRKARGAPRSAAAAAARAAGCGARCVRCTERECEVRGGARHAGSSSVAHRVIGDQQAPQTPRPHTPREASTPHRTRRGTPQIRTCFCSAPGGRSSQNFKFKYYSVEFFVSRGVVPGVPVKRKRHPSPAGYGFLGCMCVVMLEYLRYGYDTRALSHHYLVNYPSFLQI